MNKHILIIDKEIEFAQILSLLLIKEGHRVTTTETIESVLSLPKQTPDPILLDLVMPEINNLDIIRIIKQNAITSVIPIIVLSPKISETDEIICLEVGADDYMQKSL